MIKNISYKSRVVKIGLLWLGGEEDVRVQSMTNTPTMDTEVTYRQIMELYEAGCELVRLTARNIREAENLGVIRNMLESNGIYIPLAADIHFNPEVAERAAAIVHKVRINPGNYLDQQHFLTKENENKIENIDPEIIREGVIRLTDICRENNTVIRVGVNHGSLSDRILRQYGNTAEGMIVSAMEFLKICRDASFNELVVSMKSSHVPTMVKATSGIVDAMILEGMDYPIHLGVTEAGEGEDGRIRSASGIGPLLEHGIGDTIRVSLTEDPVAEIPVAKCLVEIHRNRHKPADRVQSYYASPGYHYKQTKDIGIIGNNNPPRVIGDSSQKDDTLRKADLILGDGINLKDHLGREYSIINFTDPEELGKFLDSKKEKNSDKVFMFTASNGYLLPIRKMFDILQKKKNKAPVLLKLKYFENDEEILLLRSASDLSSLILDGYGNGYCLGNKNGKTSLHPDIVFGILQATGVRITGTEYISCPGCGRTNFDIQGILKKVKENTKGLDNVKIAVMGCIVNGPGEMADADFGYVGAGKGKVTLYQSGKVVKKNIPEEDALEALMLLINKS